MIFKEITEEIIKEYVKNPSRRDWYDLCCTYKLPESFIREFKDKFYIPYLFAFQDLSEDFIRDFKDATYWVYIFEYQNLSEAFMIEFLDYLDPWYLRKNKKIPQDLKDKIIAMKALMS
jgi:hypothetical protein